jgi:glycosyltransferase involved in cell wall biosynthesis
MDSTSRSHHQVVFAGTLTEKKGIVQLAHAWRFVRSECPYARLHVFGKDEIIEGGKWMSDHIRQIIRDDIARSVTIHGHVSRSDLLKWYGRARVAVFPSFSETYGLAPFEAMACACPTIYTSRPPGPELLESGRHAILVDPGSPIELANGIISLLRNDQLADTVGRAGQDIVRKKYCVEALLSKNIECYSDCIRQFRAISKKRRMG